jgi:hypothetical protein
MTDTELLAELPKHSPAHVEHSIIQDALAMRRHAKLIADNRRMILLTWLILVVTVLGLIATVYFGLM